jgi:hypothetical protein
MEITNEQAKIIGEAIGKAIGKELTSYLNNNMVATRFNETLANGFFGIAHAVKQSMSAATSERV